MHMCPPQLKLLSTGGGINITVQHQLCKGDIENSPPSVVYIAPITIIKHDIGYVCEGDDHGDHYQDSENQGGGGAL